MHGLITNFHSGVLGASSIFVMVLVVVSLLRTVESALNQIWHAPRNRGWGKSIVYYWTTVTLGPLLLAAGFGLSAANRLDSAKTWILTTLPTIGPLVFSQIPPLTLLIVGFTLFYRLMPNTKVRFPAALFGGVVAGLLIHLNSAFGAAFYNSQGETYSAIYGGLVAIPLFMAGVYISWLIVLYGAQVAYGLQNTGNLRPMRRASTPESSPGDHGQPALYLMHAISSDFAQNRPARSVDEYSQTVGLTRSESLAILACLEKSELVASSTNRHQTKVYRPARPADAIQLQEILDAVRPKSEKTFPCIPENAAIRQAWERIRKGESREATRLRLSDLIQGGLAEKPSTGRPGPRRQNH